MGKVFGEFKNIEDINKTALSLREECEPDQIETLGKENETPIEKIERELKKENSKTVPAAPIANYLITKCKEDEKFASRVNLKSKSLKECFDYVYQEVKKRLKEVSGWINDSDVYEMAETYFNLDILKLVEKRPELPKRDISSTITKEKELEKPKPKSKLKQSKKVESGQLTLFDFMR